MSFPFFRKTLTNQFDGLVVPEGRLFYPCCGDDTWEPIRMFADSINEYHFVDIQRVPRFPHFDCTGESNEPCSRIQSVSPRIVSDVSTPESKECPISDSAKAVLARLGEEQWKYVRNEPEVVAQRLTLASTPPRDLDVFRYRQDGLAAFLELDKISVFFLRRDSMGEGGSGQMWFQPKLFDLILDKLVDGGLIVTDGSGSPFEHGRDGLAWSPLWMNARSRQGEEPDLPNNFTYAGRDFKCLGSCGRGYGPVYAWQVGEFRASRLRESRPAWFQDLAETLRAEGISNAHAAVETITNFLFLHESRNCDKGRPVDWNELLRLPQKELYQRFRNEIPSICRELKSNGVDADPRSFEFKNPVQLYKFIGALDDIVRRYERDTTSIPSGRGRFYEDLLNFYFATGIRGGETYTPGHIVRTIVELMDPKPGEVVGDPACGTGGFLIESLNHTLSDSDDNGSKPRLSPFGFDYSLQAASMARMNLMLHGGEVSHIYCCDSFSDEMLRLAPAVASDAFDLLMVNPPFASSVDFRSLEPSLHPWARSKRSEVTMAALMLRMLKQDGRAAMIVPANMLTGGTTISIDLRRHLLEDNRLDGVISFPGETLPGTSIPVFVLIFRKGGRTENVFYYSFQGDEDSKEKAPLRLSEDDLCDLIAQWKEWQAGKSNGVTPKFAERQSRCFVVSREEIAENNFDLSPNRYQEIVVKPAEFEPPVEILAKLKAKEREVLDNYDILEDYLKK